MSGRKRPKFMKKITGLIFLSMGVGMLIVALLPGWGLFLGACAVIVGFWMFFL